jgi:4-amino-4-deoxy-L-arabinose transferase-like glycosyltransferase
MPTGNRFFSSKWAGISLILLCLTIYLVPVTQYPLNRGEGMYARIPQEMLATGHWLTPTLNGARYLDKPPLLYWINLLGYKILGVSGETVRLPTLALTLGEIWLTYLIGLRLLGPRAAWLGTFVLFSCIGFFTYHIQILTDHLITLALVGALYTFLRWQEQGAFRWVVLFYLAMVAGFLSKGFIGLVFPILICSIYAWQQGQARLSSIFRPSWGMALALVLILPWFVFAEQANPGFLRHQIINEQIMRFLGQRQPPNVHSFPLLWFWFFLLLWLMPWAVLLPEALYRFWRDTGSGAADRRGRLLIIWAAVILGFFTLSPSRLEYYSLPALPALALILGWRADRCLKDSHDRKLAWGLVTVSLLGLGILLLLPLLEQLFAEYRREFIGMCTLVKPTALWSTCLIPALGLLGAWVGWRRPWLTFLSYGTLALVCLYFTYQTLVILSPLISDKIPGEYLRLRAGPEDLVVMEGPEELEHGASLAFYSRCRILMVKRHGFPQFTFSVPPTEDYLITPEHFQELWLGPRMVFLLVDSATPTDPSLTGAPLAWNLHGKRLLVNRP